MSNIEPLAKDAIVMIGCKCEHCGGTQDLYVYDYMIRAECNWCGGMIDINEALFSAVYAPEEPEENPTVA